MTNAVIRFCPPRSPQMHSLVKCCEDAITGSLDFTICHELLQKSRCEPEHKDVHSSCINFMAPSYSELVRHSSFVSLDVECLHDMLGSDLIDMDEADVFLSVVRWLGHGDNAAESGSFLGLLRWCHMPAEFVENTVRSNPAFASVESDLNRFLLSAYAFQLLPSAEREEGPQTKRRKGPAGKGFGHPDYGSVAGVVVALGSGLGAGPGQFNTAGTMNQVCFGSDGTVWAVDCDGHRVHHFKQSGEVIKTIGTGTAGNAPGELNQPRGMAVPRLGSSIYRRVWPQPHQRVQSG
jgi:hypothetical protein